MLRHVRHLSVRAVERLTRLPFQLTVGSSGTIESLAQLEAANFGGDGATVSAEGLGRVARLIYSLPIAERRKVAGLNPARADIIIGGVAILQGLMSGLKIDRVSVSGRGLKDGLLADWLGRTEAGRASADLSLRERGVFQFGRSVNFDEPHARTVARIALELFDSGRAIGIHRRNDAERELLYFAALLHDCGAFLSYHNHHAHGHYFIRNADLLGFTQEELEVMAVTVLFHRKEYPRKKVHPEFAALDPKAQDAVRVLCVLLRMAESLDRSHSGVVKKAEFREGTDGTVALELTADRDCSLEYWGVRRHHKAFEKSFGRRLTESCAWVSEPEVNPPRRRKAQEPSARPPRSGPKKATPKG